VNFTDRTKSTIKNVKTGLINKTIMLIFPFIIRTILIKKLGADYLGLSSLFTSILQVLNLTELGFSNAIVYSMYKPLAENDVKKVSALMNFNKKVYRIMGLLIATIGLCLLPFIKNFISGSIPNDINVYILYVIYLTNTVLTYFLFAYKSALLTANQRNDILNNISSLVNVIQFVAQIIVLITLKNYYIYIILTIFTTILNNLLVSYIFNKKYSNYNCSGNICKNEKKELKKNVYGLMIQKLCQTSRNSLDSIFISMFLGLTTVAIYNNYYYIMNAVTGILTIIISNMVASIGNSVATEKIQKNYNDMNKFNFIYMWISGWCTISLLCLFQPFMNIWMGNEYMFPFSVVICLCLYFYQLKVSDIISIYKQAAGTWYSGRFEMILETLVNLILNIILGKLYGVYGIILSTFISLLLVGLPYGTYIIFKYYFKNMSMKKYHLRHIVYFIVTIIIAAITYFITSFIIIGGIPELLFKGIICLIVPNILYYIIYVKTPMFKESKDLINKILKLLKFKKTKIV